jgi:hypothetical protein
MKNAALTVRVKNWGINQIDPYIAWVDLEFQGSFQDDNGQVVFEKPEVKQVQFDLHPEMKSKGRVTTGFRDPRHQGPI